MIIHGLILAAGESARLGQPKQLIQYQGSSLLQMTENKVNQVVSRTWVVLGHQAGTCAKEINSADIIINKDWQAGQNRSLHVGLKHAIDGADAVLVAVCDQPRIGASHYHKMVQLAQVHPNLIIASAYQDTLGVPVVYPLVHCCALLENPDLSGARYLQQQKPCVHPILCEPASFDVDHPRDLECL